MEVFWALRWLLMALIVSSTQGAPSWNESFVHYNHTALLEPRNYHHELPPVPNSKVLEDWIEEQFDLLKMDYKEFLVNINRELDFQRRSGPGRQRQIDKAPWILELVQTVSKVSIGKSSDRCTACRAGVGLILHFLRERATTEELKMIGYGFCMSVKMQTPRICKAYMELFMDQAVYILKRISLTPEEICSFVLEKGCGDFDHPAHRWNVSLPPALPEQSIERSAAPTVGQSVFKVLHISDTHYDPYYQSGTNADCNEPLCCRMANGPASSAEKAAGIWGDYRACDTPKRTMVNMLEHIAKKHQDIDYILWTGDVYPHNALNETAEDFSLVLKETAQMLLTAFPKIPIFPALGNHDTLPPNCFPQPMYNQDANISWLYEELNKRWPEVMLNYTDASVQHGAFYSASIRPGFRIISLNTLYGYSKNGWLLLNSTDPGNMLEWFIAELLDAEREGDKVHVIGHVPPGMCLKEWSRNYNRIINRFKSTITGQFYGHTHMDEFELFYDPEDNNLAVSIAYLGPSVTPFVGYNPGYRIYYIDGDHDTTTRSVLDHETWAMNLNEANLYNFPVWYKLYSARSAYNMESLEPQEWDNFVMRMARDPDLFDLFYTHRSKNSSVSGECDRKCKKDVLCKLKSGRSHYEEELCNEIDDILGATSRIHFSWMLIVLSVILSFYSVLSTRLDI